METPSSPPQSIQCVIFDCDGVLVDSEIIANQTALEMLEPYGFTMSQAEYGRRFAGKTEEDILTIVQRDYGIDLPGDLLARLRLEIERRLDEKLQPIPGMKEVVAGLTLPKAVVSNSRLVRVIASLWVAGLSELFGKQVYAVDMVERPKPAPDLYQYAAQQLDVPPAACLVVEDSQSGVTAAHRAGMPVIGFLAASHIPAGHEQTVREAGAWATATDADELAKLIRTALES